MNKIFLTIVLSFCLVLIVHNSVDAQGSRPMSHSCYITGQIIEFSGGIDKSNGIEKYSLKLKISESECSNISIGEIVASWWYPPDTPYGKSTEKYANVDKLKVSLNRTNDRNKVLNNGAIIKAAMDSYDHILTYVNLIQEASGDYKSQSKNNLNYYILTLVGLFVIMFFIGRRFLIKNKK